MKRFREFYHKYKECINVDMVGFAVMIELIIFFVSWLSFFSLDVNINNQCEGDRWTPLHQAANGKLNSNVALLIDRGANLIIKNSDGISALGYILQYCDEDTISYTVNHLVTNYKPESEIDFNQEINCLQTNDSVDLIKMLEIAETLSTIV